MRDSCRQRSKSKESGNGDGSKLTRRKVPIAGFSNAAMDAAEPELAAEDESVEPLLEYLAVVAEDAAEDG